MEAANFFAPFFEFISDYHVLKPLFLFILLVISLKIFFGSARLKKFPPGPRGLPFVGYLPFKNENFHKELIVLEKTYGKIMSMNIGRIRTVILNDFYAIKESNNKDEFSGKPPDFFKLSDTTENIGVLNGQPWKETRRFMFSALRTLGMGKNRTEEYIKSQIAIMLDDIEKHVGKDVEIRSLVGQAINNTIIHLTFGRFQSDGFQKFMALMSDYTEICLEYLVHYEKALYFPAIRPFIPLFNSRVRECRKRLDEMEQIVWKEIEFRQKQPNDSVPEDYMDLFLEEIKRRKDNLSTFTNGILNGNSQILILGGSDTIKASVEWAVLLLAKYPEVQEKAFKELVEVLGENKLPSWEDRHNLPYLEAFILEVARFKTLSPLAPHWTIEDSTVQGYSIPKDTMIFDNIYAVHNDPKLFPEPEVFRPERYLINNGQKCKAPEYLIPFNIGKRMCPGEKLANMQVFLFVASLLQRFKFSEPQGGVNLNDQLFIVIYAISTKVRIEQRTC